MLLSLSVAGLLASAQPFAGPAAEDPEITIIGQRLKRIRVETRKNRKTGVVGCRVKRTSGDAALDSQVCEAVLACARTARKAADMEGCLAPRFAAFANPHQGHTDSVQ